MKEDIKKLINGVRTLHNDQAIRMLCDELEKQLEINEANLTIKQNLADENQRLRATIDGMHKTLNGVLEAAGEDWQDVDDLPNVVKAMADIVEQRQAAPVSHNQQLLEQMIADVRKLSNPQNPAIPPMSPECLRQHAAMSALNGFLADGGDTGVAPAMAVRLADALLQELAK